MYDIFYVSKYEVDESDWIEFKKKYPSAQRLDNVNSFDQIQTKSFTKMMWVVWNDLVLDPSFDLSSYRASKWDDMYIHVFKNSSRNFNASVILIPKKLSISKKEFDNRYYINKKEVDINASFPRPYVRYEISNYNDYLSAMEKSPTELFWGIWKEVALTDNSVLEEFFDPKDGRFDWDRAENHVFKNKLKGEETYKNGIVLFSKNKPVSKKEIDYRFILERKEHDRLVSKMKPFDIVFISYNEPNADSNYERLKSKFPTSKRVHGVKGIHNAHIEAAKLSNTDMFWVVDGDAYIIDSFNFDFEVDVYEKNIVHVWRSKNPINDLEYGYGGVKLLPKTLTLEMDLTKPDMTTGISKFFKAVSEVSNVTAFNTDEFSTWKSAFRECVKLSSRIIDRQDDEETKYRLKVWCTEGKDRHYGNFAISGANAGKEYGEKYAKDDQALKMINDFDWLYNYWKNLNG